MEEYLVLISCVCFIAFFISGRFRKYPAIAGWTALVLFLFASVPFYVSENNFLYPIMAVISVPFLLITAKYLLRDDPRVIRLSWAAGIAFLIFAPFAFIPGLGNALIGIVVNEVNWVLSALQVETALVAWDTFERNGFQVQIILACTGIQGIAIMLGVAGAVPTSWRQKILAFLLIVPTIYLLNIARNTAVIIAYTGQWFPYFPEIAGNGQLGYESFFWAHNVIAEGLALVLLIGIAYGLFRLIPDLGKFAIDLYDLYRDEVMGFISRLQNPGPGN